MKRFFTEFFPADSPREAAVSAFSLILLELVLVPPLCVLFRIALFSGNTAIFAGALVSGALLLLAGIFSSLLLTGSFLRLNPPPEKDAEHRNVPTALFLSFVFLLLPQLYLTGLLYYALRTRNRMLFFFSLPALALFLYCAWLLFPVSECRPWPIWISLCGTTLLLALASFQLPSPAPLRKRALLPLLPALLCLLGLHFAALLLERRCQSEFHAIEAIAGEKQTGSAPAERGKHHFALSPDPEPLKALLQWDEPPFAAFREWYALEIPEDFPERFEDFQRRNTFFLRHLDALTHLPPAGVRHGKTADSRDRSEVNVFRKGAFFYQAQAIDGILKRDGKRVMEAVSKIISLRRWAERRNSFWNAQGAMNIHAILLSMLPVLLRSELLTDQELLTLQAALVEWDASAVEKAGKAMLYDYALLVKERNTLLMRESAERLGIPLSSPLRIFAPAAFTGYFRLSLLTALRHCRDAFRSIVHPDGDASLLADRVRIQENKAERRKKIFPGMKALEFYPRSFLRFHDIADQNRSAIAAIGAMRYRNRYGRLPDSLISLVPWYLPLIPRDSKNNHPLFYEKGLPAFCASGGPADEKVAAGVRAVSLIKGFRVYASDASGVRNPMREYYVFTVAVDGNL